MSHNKPQTIADVDPDTLKLVLESLGLRRCTPLPIAQFQTQVLERYYAACEVSTAKGIRRLFKHFPRLQIASTADLTYSKIVEFVALRQRDGVRSNTIVGELGRLRAVCNLAVRFGALAEPPFRPRERLVRAEPALKGSHLELVELQRLLSRLESEIADAITEDAGRRHLRFADPRRRKEWRARRLYALGSGYSFTGARKNELLYAWVEDVDLERRIFEINPARRRLKTPGSARKVPIPDELAEVWEDWLPRTGCQWLFPGARGVGPWVGGSKGYRPLDCIKAACARAGVPDGGIHLFRHSFVTMCEGWGVPREGAMRITGITQGKTLGIYAHADEANLRSFVEDVAIRGRKTAQA